MKNSDMREVSDRLGKLFRICIPNGLGILFLLYVSIFTGAISIGWSLFDSASQAPVSSRSQVGDDYAILAPGYSNSSETKMKDSSQGISGYSSGGLVIKSDTSGSEGTQYNQVKSLESSSEVVTEHMVNQVIRVRTPNLDSAPRRKRAEQVSQATTQDNNTSLTAVATQYEFVLANSTDQAKKLRRLLEKVVISSKFQQKISPITIELVNDREEPRGRMTSDSVSLITSIPTESESIRVFVHELGHIIDIHYLKENVFGTDASDDFYSISWKDYQTKKAGQNYEDFVSGYAMTNKYEDFAESFSEYVFANERFKKKAQSNRNLEKKYEYFRTRVFTEDEFIGTNFEQKSPVSYVWDTTKTPVEVNKYLYYIK